ncbi:zinc ribbon domain-containing protein [Cronobacter sakazakii]|nr:zinc ribbon domain-containing protein [Cronobacter sakazakii]
MKYLGWTVLLVGVLWAVVALNMDVSVETGYGTRVNNIGLMAARQNHIIIGAFITLCGLLMAIFGNRKDDSGPLVKCPFCAELVKPEAVKCKHCGSYIEHALNKQRDTNFKPTDMPFDDFFIRKGDELIFNKNSVDLLIARLKKANPEMHPINISRKYQDDVAELISQLPSKIQEDFKKYYSKKLA